MLAIMTVLMKKKALRETQTLSALAVVRFGHRLLARPLHTNTQTGPITIHCAAKLCVQCNYNRECCACRCGKKYPLKFFGVFSGVYVLNHPCTQ